MKRWLKTSTPAAMASTVRYTQMLIEGMKEMELEKKKLEESVKRRKEERERKEEEQRIRWEEDERMRLEDALSDEEDAAAPRAGRRTVSRPSVAADHVNAMASSSRPMGQHPPAARPMFQSRGAEEMEMGDVEEHAAQWTSRRTVSRIPVAASRVNATEGPSRLTGLRSLAEMPVEQSTDAEEEDPGRRQSARPRTVAKRREDPPVTPTPVKKPRLAESRLLPKPDISLLVLLDSGETGEDGATELPTDDLEANRKEALLGFWNEMVGKGKKLLGDRFNVWFKGGSFEEKCLAEQLGPKAKSDWSLGKGYACKYCVRWKKPCCRVVLDSAGLPIRVTVLPEAGETGMSRFEYWQVPWKA